MGKGKHRHKGMGKANPRHKGKGNDTGPACMMTRSRRRAKRGAGYSPNSLAAVGFLAGSKGFMESARPVLDLFAGAVLL